MRSKVLRAGIVEMHDRPAQWRDRRVAVDALQHLQQVMHRGVAVPMLGQRHAARCGPAGDLVILLLLRLGRAVVVVHAPGDVLAHAVEAQHVVAESHGQQLRERPVVFQFIAAVLCEQLNRRRAPSTCDRSRPEQRLVLAAVRLKPPGVADAGEAEPVELTEELPGAQTLCSKVGRGSLSNSPLMVGLSPAIQPVGRLRRRVRACRAAARSASFRMASACMPAGVSSTGDKIHWT